MSAKKTKKKASARKPKLAVAEAPKPVVLTKHEMNALSGVLVDMQMLKDDHTSRAYSLKAKQAAVTAKLAEAEKLNAEAQVQANDVAFDRDCLLKVERRFNETKHKKEILIADICEKRGIAIQELEYNPVTGEVTNIPKATDNGESEVPV